MKVVGQPSWQNYKEMTIQNEVLVWNIIILTSKMTIEMVNHHLSFHTKLNLNIFIVVLDTPKLGVWILDGDAACSAPLLKYAIKPETLENTVLILVASMTQPWSLLSTLKKWTTLIEEHVDRLKIDPTHLQEMRDRLQHHFQHYIEPNDSSTLQTTSIFSSSTLKNGIGASRVSLASTTTLNPTNNDEQTVSPLPDGVLSKSLGIPVIVVITKVIFFF